MNSSYPEVILKDCADLIVAYDKEYPVTSRTEDAVHREFHLFIQIQFMNKDSNPLCPTKERMEGFLEVANGLDLYEVRLESMKRFFKLSKKEFPLIHKSAQELAFPDFAHRWLWRSYAKQEYKRSRELFKKANTSEIIQLEKNGFDYYESCQLAYPSNAELGHDDIHQESHQEVADLLLKIIPFKENGDYKILEYGSGDGRLLWTLRQSFPNAKLMATNIFGDSGVINAVKNDPNIEITSLGSVEDQEFEAASFDAVLSTEVIEHLVSPQEMILGAKHVLRPGGAFIITAPSLHYEFLSSNPLTYFWSFLSVFWEGFLPRFHNLWQPLTDLPIVHYAFSVPGFKSMFRKHFVNSKVRTTRYTHLKKFKLQNIAPKLPFLNRWGGLVMAYGNKDD